MPFLFHELSTGRLKIRERLEAGTTVVCDRYAYSGVAFSASKPGEKKAMQPTTVVALLVVRVLRADCLGSLMVVSYEVLSLPLGRLQSSKLSTFSTGRFISVFVVAAAVLLLLLCVLYIFRSRSRRRRPGCDMVQGPRPRVTGTGQNNIPGYFG